VALLQTLNRKTHRAFNRTREHNFRLAGLLGRDLHGQTVGIIGTGRIGAVAARILHGFGCRILAHDLAPNPAVTALGATYASLDRLLAEADILSLHVPLVPETHHLLDAAALARCKRGVTIINTSRGKLIDTEALLAALQTGQVGGVALDVYEEEEGKFFRDLSDQILDDEVLARLMTFPNVLLTSHQAFFTHEAMTTIAHTTIANLDAAAAARANENLLVAPR
jgi:D-lactate dehydrogenase